MIAAGNGPDQPVNPDGQHPPILEVVSYQVSEAHRIEDDGVSSVAILWVRLTDGTRFGVPFASELAQVVAAQLSGWAEVARLNAPDGPGGLVP